MIARLRVVPGGARTLTAARRRPALRLLAGGLGRPAGAWGGRPVPPAEASRAALSGWPSVPFRFPGSPEAPGRVRMSPVVTEKGP